MSSCCLCIAVDGCCVMFCVDFGVCSVYALLLMFVVCGFGCFCVELRVRFVYVLRLLFVVCCFVLLVC